MTIHRDASDLGWGVSSHEMEISGQWTNEERTQDTLTDYHCNCKQPMAYNNNHERTPFVEYIIPMFKYLAKETNLLGFAWCEKLVETQKYAQIADVDYNLTEIKKKIC